VRKQGMMTVANRADIWGIEDWCSQCIVYVFLLFCAFLLLYLTFAQWSTKRLKFRLEWALFALLSLGGWAKEWLHSSIQLCLYSRRVYERYVSTLYLFFVFVLYCNIMAVMTTDP
jgi:hypothetical protein